MSEQIRKYPFFTAAQQEAYERLPDKQRAYVDFRGQGNCKTDSYRMAGYTSAFASQGAFLLERNNKALPELIECILVQKRAREFGEEDSALNKQIDALALQEGAEKMLAKIEGADGETAKRIAFFRDIVSGKIKTRKVITRYNADGRVLERKVEETSDIENKMKARKELDRLLGLNQLPDLGSFNTGDITINIIDASKKEELADTRNSIELDPEDVKVIDGEEVILQEEKIVEKKAKKDKFFEEEESGE